MQNVVLTIGREYGSGGKYIGEKVAKRLGIPFYDKEILTKTYEKNGCNYSKLEEFDEVKRNSLLKQFDLLDFYHYDEKYSSDIYQKLISETIVDLAKENSCVILGRNSNKLLKDMKKALHIFIYANDLDFKVKRKMEIENLSYNDTLKRLRYVDKQRKMYYESFDDNSSWGSIRDYDYCLDSSVLGIDKTVDLIVNIVSSFSGKN